MKVFFITNKFPPLSCGVGDYTYHLAKEFVNNGHGVSVICCTNDSITDYWKVHYENFDVYPLGGNWQRKDLTLVLEKIKAIAPDSILFQYVPGSFNRYAVPWDLIYFYKQLNKLSVKILTTFHETYVRYNFNHPKYLYVALGQRLIARYLAKNSHQLMTSIDRYEQQLKSWNRNVTIIPVGSNILTIPVSTGEIETIRKRFAPNEEAILCTFGIRNHQTLLDLFQEVVNLKSNTVLLIIGKLNANLECLPQTIRKKVYSTGFLEADEVYRHLKASDAFVMMDFVSKNGEGGTCNKSGSLAAAFAAGLPIFATKGDMTNKLLLEKSKIIWLQDKNNALDLIITHLESDNSDIHIDNQMFFNNYLSWSVIYSRIISKLD